MTIGDPGDVYQCPLDVDGIGTISAFVDHGDGTYSATYMAGTTDAAGTLRHESNASDWRRICVTAQRVRRGWSDAALHGRVAMPCVSVVS